MPGLLGLYALSLNRPPPTQPSKAKLVRDDSLSITPIMTPFNLNQLLAFITVAECRSFSEAARRLGKAQSAISSLIANLEAELGVSLFLRDRHKTKVTPAGEVLLPQAKLILTNCEGLSEKAAAINQEQEVYIRIAISQFAIDPAYMSVLQAFSDQFPHVQLNFIEVSPVKALDLLREGEVEFASVFKTNLSFEGLICWIFPQQRMGLTCGIDHPLAKLKQVTRNDLMQYRQLLIQEPGESVEYSPIKSPNVWTTQSYSKSWLLLVHGLGWMMMPEQLLEPDLRIGSLVKLNLQDDSDEWRLAPVLAWRTGWEPGPASQFIIDHLRALSVKQNE